CPRRDCLMSACLMVMAGVSRLWRGRSSPRETGADSLQRLARRAKLPATGKDPCMKALLTAAGLTATALPAAPVLAFDLANMTEDEKAAFGEAVREYLMENPEVLIESINVLEERRAADEVKNDQLLVENNREAIF